MRLKPYHCWLFILMVIVCASDCAAAGFRGGGMKGGVNISNLRGEDAEASNAESITGYLFGAHINFSIAEYVSIQPEMYLAKKGAKGDTLFWEGRVELYYIDVPVLIRYDFLRKEKIASSLFTGPYISYELDANAITELGGREINVDIDELVKSYDFGFVIGIEVGMPTDWGQVILDVRYAFGMTNLDDTRDDSDIKNSVISIIFGLSFGNY